MILSSQAVHIANSVKRAVQGALHLVIADNKKEAYFLASDLDNFFREENLFFFPATSEKSEYKKNTALLQRTATLSALTRWTSSPVSPETPEQVRGDDDHEDYLITKELLTKELLPSVIIVTYTEAVEEKVLRPKSIRSAVLTLRKGESLSHGSISDILFEEGFRKVDFVTQPGEFALRGSLVDIYSFADERPLRIDFFGDEIESIRWFNPDNQLSAGDPLPEISIYPNLDEIGEAQEYANFMDVLPEGTVIWDLRDDILQKEEGNIVPQPAFAKNFQLLSDDIVRKQIEGYTVTILSPNESQTRRLKEILRNVSPQFLPVSLHEGYIDKASKNCYYTDHQIFERYHKLSIHRQVEKAEQMTINDLNALRMGDYIVHIDHGVGQYGGLVKTHVGGRTQEAVKLIYRDGDVVFVSIHSLHRISKYKSRDGEPPKIYKLGSKAWENLKRATKSKVKDIAEDLIKLYSERQQSRGFAFSADSFLQQELESSFMFEDTPDQATATEAVKADMESIHPMDRLVCGDVGFGKTEVAIRAAFKAVCDSKQVAVLVPTTILALQHWQTFQQRLKDFPVKIDYISRLRTAKEIKQIGEDIASGRTDILIGTHSILNKNLQFKDLGLLIIDEEQKFGVAAKEKIRQMKTSVDTLTLTATPIPRTLQFSLLGARDLSIINTPPPNRIPVTTEVIRFDEDYLADILNRELERGGQVYFVHNRIEDIFKIYDMLHRICPKAEICVAHGQMEPKELEGKILKFIAGDYDILLSTTIIENGIDIPNANTMIVNRAHRFGLSDLHQLRGRVGRSNVKAFCYLIVPEEERLTDDARRRIRALEAFSDLGSGFNIAMQDLDIRGAGNLLGAEQSGFMAEMGFETYMRVLREAMNELVLTHPEAPEQARITYELDTQVDTDLEIMIPDSYVNVPSEKIRLYKELDSIKSEDLLKRFTANLADRFGSPIPTPVLELIDVVRLRMMGSRMGLERIVLKNGVMLAYFISDRKHPFFESEQFGTILQQMAARKSGISLLESSGKLYFKVPDVPSVQAAARVLAPFLV
ncbi:MAG: transcription-repair coupling factor [Bacteroidales bacterium]|nr:transcription-repair coupling factor [Bacteroidales bacterium]